MEKKKLENKLKEIQKGMLQNAKDSESMKLAIDELLSIKGQLDVKPLAFNVGDKIDSYADNTFDIVKTTEGAYFKTHGGFMVFARQNLTSLYSTLVEVINSKNTDMSLSDEEKESLESYLSIILYICTLPMYAFSDIEFAISMASQIVEHQRKVYDKLMSEPLKEEELEKNEAFREAIKSMDNIKEVIDDELEKIKKD